MDQLDIMRNQLSTLKEQLDTQKIVNDSLMRRVMRGKASWLNILVKIEIWCLPFLYLFIAEISHFLGISQWYAGVFVIMAAIDVVLDWKNVRISPKRFSEDSILELKKFLLKQKKARFVQTVIGTVLSIAWLICFFSANNSAVARTMMPGLKPEDYLWATIIIGIVTSIVSIVVIALLFNKMERTTKDLIQEIGFLEKDS